MYIYIYTYGIKWNFQWIKCKLKSSMEIDGWFSVAHRDDPSERDSDPWMQLWQVGVGHCTQLGGLKEAWIFFSLCLFWRTWPGTWPRAWTAWTVRAPQILINRHDVESFSCIGGKLISRRPLTSLGIISPHILLGLLVGSSVRNWRLCRWVCNKPLVKQRFYGEAARPSI